MYTSNDYVLDNYCKNINKYSDKTIVYKHKLNKLNINLTECSGDVHLFLATLTYKILLIYIKDLNKPKSVKFLEDVYLKNAWAFLERNDNNIKLLASNWVRFMMLYNSLNTEINNFDYTIKDLVFNKTVYKKHYEVMSLHIDIFGIKGDKKTLITFTPYTKYSEHLRIVYNIDTLLCLEYLNEADLLPDEVIEYSINIDAVDRLTHRRHMPMRKNFHNFIDRALVEEYPKNPNIFNCLNCGYVNNCTSHDALYGKK